MGIIRSWGDHAFGPKKSRHETDRERSRSCLGRAGHSDCGRVVWRKQRDEHGSRRSGRPVDPGWWDGERSEHRRRRGCHDGHRHRSRGRERQGRRGGRGRRREPGCDPRRRPGGGPRRRGNERRRGRLRQRLHLQAGQPVRHGQLRLLDRHLRRHGDSPDRRHELRRGLDVLVRHLRAARQSSELRAGRSGDDQLRECKRELLHEPGGRRRHVQPHLHERGGRWDGRGGSGDRELSATGQVPRDGRPLPPVRGRARRRVGLASAAWLRQAHPPQRRRRPRQQCFPWHVRAGLGGVRRQQPRADGHEPRVHQRRDVDPVGGEQREPPDQLRDVVRGGCVLHLGWGVSAQRGGVGVRGSRRCPAARVPMGQRRAGDGKPVRHLRLQLPERLGYLSEPVEHRARGHASRGGGLLGAARHGRRDAGAGPRHRQSLRGPVHGLRVHRHARQLPRMSRRLLRGPRRVRVPVGTRRHTSRSPRRLPRIPVCPGSLKPRRVRRGSEPHEGRWAPGPHPRRRSRRSQALPRRSLTVGLISPPRGSQPHPPGPPPHESDR